MLTALIRRQARQDKARGLGAEAAVPTQIYIGPPSHILILLRTEGTGKGEIQGKREKRRCVVFPSGDPFLLFRHSSKRKKGKQMLLYCCFLLLTSPIYIDLLCQFLLKFLIMAHPPAHFGLQLQPPVSIAHCPLLHSHFLTPVSRALCSLADCFVSCPHVNAGVSSRDWGRRDP